MKEKSFVNRISVYLDKNLESKIFKNILKLITGEGIGRLIGIITMPIIVRIYTPEDIGILSVFVSFLALLAPFATLRYSTAIPLPQNDKIAINALSLSLLVLILTTITLLTALLFGHEYIFDLFSVSEISPYWYLLPVGFLGIGIYDTLQQWAIRKKYFSVIAKTKVNQKTLGTLTKITLGLIGLKPLGLIIGDIFTQMGGISTLLKKLKDNITTNYKYIAKEKIIFLFKYYRSMPIYKLPSGFLLLLSGKIPILFFAMRYDMTTTGQLGLATTMLSIPVSLIAYSTGSAFFGEIAQIGKNKKEEIAKLTKGIVKKLFLLSIIPFLTIVLIGPWLFKLFFGAEWIQAGEFARLLSPYLLMQFIYSPIGDGVINVFGKQKYNLIIEMIRVAIVSSVFMFAYFNHLEIHTLLLCYSLGLTIHYTIGTILIFKIIK